MSDQSMIRGHKFMISKTQHSKTIMICWSRIWTGMWIACAPVLAASAATPDWAIQADYTDACSCNVPCPCLFGGSSTHGFCRGTTLLEIEEGHFGQIDFAGVTVLAVYDAGKWVRFLVSENATKEQTDAVADYLIAVEGFFEAPQRDARKRPISVTRTDDTVTITAEGTRVEMTQVKSADGESIKTVGLPANGFPGVPFLGHTQYKTAALSHDSEMGKFNFSGSNGFTARINASGNAKED